MKQEKAKEERQKHGDAWQGKKFRKGHGRRRGKEDGEMETAHSEAEAVEQNIDIDSKPVAATAESSTDPCGVALPVAVTN